MSDFENYIGTTRFDNVQLLFGNHFKFVIDALPDVSFFVQTVSLPEVTAGVADRPNPFTNIPEVGDHLHFGTLDVTFVVDNLFKTFFSLMYWLRGYGFPNGYQDVLDFQASRVKAIGNPRPLLREIQKTNATLYVLSPDSDTPVAEVHFMDVFPVTVAALTFDTTSPDPPLLTCHVVFRYTDFDVRLIAH